MRKYHIYIQRTKAVECHCEYAKYKWLPWEYLGYLIGTKEVYIYFKTKYDKQFYNKFNYFENEYMYTNCDFMIAAEYHRYLIMDDKGIIRDFHELTDQYKKKIIRHYGARGGGFHTHLTNLVSDQRKSITPEEIKDIKNEYGIFLRSIKPKRNINQWHYKNIKNSGWKMQSKRRKQWRVKNV